MTNEEKRNDERSSDVGMRRLWQDAKELNLIFASIHRDRKDESLRLPGFVLCFSSFSRHLNFDIRH